MALRTDTLRAFTPKMERPGWTALTPPRALPWSPVHAQSDRRAARTVCGKRVTVHWAVKAYHAPVNALTCRQCQAYARHAEAFVAAHNELLDVVERRATPPTHAAWRFEWLLGLRTGLSGGSDESPDFKPPYADARFCAWLDGWTAGAKYRQRYGRARATEVERW